MEALVTNVNWLAVGLSTIVSYLFASFWYSPMAFGAKWAAGLGLKYGAQGGFSMNALVCQFFATLLLAWIISLAVANDSIAFIFLISFTIFFFVLTAKLMSGARNYSSLVEATFVLTMSLIMTACNFLL